MRMRVWRADGPLTGTTRTGGEARELLMSRSHSPVVNLYASFEPKAIEFTDEIIRSSLLLPLGSGVGNLNNIIAELNQTSNSIFNQPYSGLYLGLNPGFTVGELEVLNDLNWDIRFSPNKIYALQKVPSDIKPIAGILTVSEGNLVSHVQLPPF